MEFIDKDGDGVISFDEFQSAIQDATNKKDNEMLESAFNKLDINGDGSLDFNEIAAVLENSNLGESEDFDKHVHEFIELYDKDGDKLIDKQEFTDAMKAFKMDDTSEVIEASFADFQIKQGIGKGAYGKMFLVEKNDTKEKFVMKAAKKSEENPENK